MKNSIKKVVCVTIVLNYFKKSRRKDRDYSMTTFEDLYKRLAKESLNNNENELQKIKDLDYDPYDLDCLLNPEEPAVAGIIGSCNCESNNEKSCNKNCILNESYDQDNNIIIDDTATDYSGCAETCNGRRLKANKDIVQVIRTLKSKKSHVYALIAPAFQGQFSESVTSGKLRNAFKQLGFDGMVEVALFADILTLKEALEFDLNIKNKGDYQLTSCCCPIWIAMIKKIYKELIPHVPSSVSPMIACGRTIKKLHPEATTIFIGPCVAKKAEAKEEGLRGAIDFVLTFREVKDIFDFVDINPDNMEETTKDHSSRTGRIYARSGGVSEAVKDTLERLNPNREIKIKIEKAQGVRECKAMVNSLLNGETSANFFEGMGCVNGCVGGPKALIDPLLGRKNVDVYGDNARYKTPIDNPYVIELLHRLGFDTVEEFLEKSDIFERNL